MARGLRNSTKMEQISLRLPVDLIDDLNKLKEKEQIDRSTIIVAWQRNRWRLSSTSRSQMRKPIWRRWTTIERGITTKRTDKYSPVYKLKIRRSNTGIFGFSFTHTHLFQIQCKGITYFWKCNYLSNKVINKFVYISSLSIFWRSASFVPHLRMRSWSSSMASMQFMSARNLRMIHMRFARAGE